VAELSLSKDSEREVILERKTPEDATYMPTRSPYTARMALLEKPPNR
jgi:hypothetical protein